jgi:hypothetical protein
MKQETNKRVEMFFARFKIYQREAGYNTIFYKGLIISLLEKALNWEIVIEHKSDALAGQYRSVVQSQRQIYCYNN